MSMVVPAIVIMVTRNRNKSIKEIVSSHWPKGLLCDIHCFKISICHLVSQFTDIVTVCAMRTDITYSTIRTIQTIQCEKLPLKYQNRQKTTSNFKRKASQLVAFSEKVFPVIDFPDWPMVQGDVPVVKKCIGWWFWWSYST